MSSVLPRVHSHSHARWRTRLGWGVALGLSAQMTLTTTASAAPVPDYEAPFPCGQQWVGTTRSSHSPSVYSVDFNRPDDIGDLTVATAPGVVSRVADLGGSSYGKYVILDHGNGASSLYAHMLEQYVAVGQRLDQGAVLGLVGTSGGSTGPHLHFEERVDGVDQKPVFHQEQYTFGTELTSANCPDVPTAGDWDGDGSAQVGVFRRNAVGGVFRLGRPGRKPVRVAHGYSSDTPVVGDWDGDGRTDVGSRTAASRTFTLRSRDGTTVSVGFGRISDVPVSGDWDGNGTTEVGRWRPSTARFSLRTARRVHVGVTLGTPGSLPVTGDWDGDRITDVGVFDAANGTFTLRTRPRTATPVVRTFAFGSASDLPVAGDWDGNGLTDVGVWNPRTADFSLRVGTSRRAADVMTRHLGRVR